jgi:hypothetical protein
VWAAFDAAEQGVIQERYRQIEQRNQQTLNLAAGLEDYSVPIVGGGVGVDGQVLEISGGDQVSSFELQLRPDTRAELAGDGLSAHDAWAKGEGSVLVGDVPERTQRLMDDLLRGIEGQLDEARSTPETEMWAGNVAGQPVWVDRHHDTVGHTDEQGNRVQLPVVSMRVYSKGYMDQRDKAAAKRVIQRPEASRTPGRVNRRTQWLRGIARRSP